MKLRMKFLKWNLFHIPNLKMSVENCKIFIQISFLNFSLQSFVPVIARKPIFDKECETSQLSVLEVRIPRLKVKSFSD